MAFDPGQIRDFERCGFDRAASAYETAFAPATRPFIPRLLDAACVGAGMDVLDLCCGPGFAGAEAMTRGARATGLDFSEPMLREGRARFPTMDFVHGDAENPPFEPARFDAAVSNFGIHHVPRPALALAAMHRILRPHGKLAFSIWAGHDENIAFKLIADAVRGFGDRDASGAPPPGGGFATGADCLTVLHEAGFVDAGAHLFRGVWRHRNAAAMLAAMRDGTARNAAMLAAQSPDRMPAIEAGLDQSTAPWRDTDGLAVPIACVIAYGTRP